MTDKSKEALVSRCCKFSCTYVHERLELGATSQQGFQAKRLERQANKCGDKGESFNVVYRDWPAAFCLPRNS